MENRKKHGGRGGQFGPGPDKTETERAREIRGSRDAVNVLIVYAGRHGTTARAAKRFAECFDSAAVRDLNAKNIRADASRYDAVIIGSAVYRGQIETVVTKWMMKNEKTLAGKRCGVFLCNAFPDEAPDIAQQCFPKAFLAECAFVGSVGGVIPEKGLSLADRMWLAAHRRMRKAHGAEELVPAFDDRDIPGMAGGSPDNGSRKTGRKTPPGEQRRLMTGCGFSRRRFPVSGRGRVSRA